MIGISDVEKIAVLGAGAAGPCLAGLLTFNGYKVNLYELPRFKENIRPIIDQGGIEIVGAKKGFAELNKITTEIKDAIKGTDLILTAVQSFGHEIIAESCVPYLEDGQIIVLCAGYGGSLLFANLLKEKEAKKDILIGETETMPLGARRTGPAQVRCLYGLRKKPIGISAFPAKHTDKLVNAVDKIFGVTSGSNSLEVGLNISNILFHAPGSILNIGAIERKNYFGEKYYFYRDAITPSVFEVIKALRNEKRTLYDVLGWKEPSRWSLGPEEVFRTCTSWTFQIAEGPSGIHHRYITESVPSGLVLLASLGEMMDIFMPVAESLITLASVISKTDYRNEGRTVEKLGISGLSADELNEYLLEGEI